MRSEPPTAQLWNEITHHFGTTQAEELRAAFNVQIVNELAPWQLR
jgi:hypothetical protein